MGTQDDPMTRGATRALSALPDASRATPEQLAAGAEAAARSPVVQALLQAADGVMLVLNRQRQVIAWNEEARRAAGVDDLTGLRPGDAFACVNARNPGGCGAAPACRVCGALGAVVRSRASGRSAEAECLMRTERETGMGALEFNVKATPLPLEGEPCTIVALRDISGEKRRQALEQMFLHDLANTVSGLRGWAARLRQARPGEPIGLRAAQRIDLLSGQLEREIDDHRALVLAESGVLTASPRSLRAADVLGDVETVFSFHPAGEGKRLEIEAPPPELEVWSDPALLVRVLVNMVRNALEASAAGGTARVRADTVGPTWHPPANGSARQVRFAVHNDGAIPPEVQLRIFQRSFSTKARGRGLGTYGMKLLGERVLGGEVTFRSDPASGTTFSLTLPPEHGPGPDPSR
jgi:signal transduction histidine kinase